MKKILLSLPLLLVASVLFAQHPIGNDSFALQTLGNSNTLVKSKGPIGADSGFVNSAFADTAAANRSKIKNYPGAQIRTGNIIWIRNSDATRWVNLHGIDSTSLADLTAGYGLIAFDGNPYNPLTGPKTFVVDTSALLDYFNNYYTNITNPSDSASFTFIVYSIDATPNLSYANGTQVLVAASGTTGAFVGKENWVGKLIGGVYTFPYGAPESGDQLLLSNDSDPNNPIVRSYRYDGTQWILTAIFIVAGGQQLGAPLPVGTNDNYDFIIKTNDTGRVRFDPTGNTYFNKYTGLETLPLYFKPGPNGLFDTGRFSLPIYDSPALQDSVMYVEGGLLKYGTAPGGGGGSSPAGNYGNVQLNRNSTFATPASDSLSFSSARLNIKGGLTVDGTVTLTGTTAANNADDSMLVRKTSSGVVGYRAIPSAGTGGDSTFKRLQWVNVKDWGARGDGVTNDRTAIQNAINSAFTNNDTAVIYFQNGVYNVQGLVTSAGGYSLNSVLYIPVNEYGDSLNRKTLIFLGESAPSFEEQILTSVHRPTNGVIIYSPTNGSGTTPALISSPLPHDNWFGLFNYTNVEFYNMGFRTHNNSGMIALDLYNMTQEKADNIRIDIDSTALSQTSPSGTGSIGFRMPKALNHAWLINGKILVSGYEKGIQLGEHASIKDLIVAGCIHGVYGTAQPHSIFLDNVDFEGVKNSITVGDRMSLHIQNYNTEHNNSSWWAFSKDINYIGSGTDSTIVVLDFAHVEISGVGPGPLVTSPATGKFWWQVVTGEGSTAFQYNVGIGINPPLYDLHTYKSRSGSVVSMVENPNSGTSGEAFVGVKSNVAIGGVGAWSSTYSLTNLQSRVGLTTSTGSGLALVTFNSTPIDFYTTGISNRRMSIAAGGNVDIVGSLGIGATPSYDLHVSKSVGSAGAVIANVQNTNAAGEAASLVTSTAGWVMSESFGGSFGSGLSSSGIVSSSTGLTGGLAIVTKASAPLAFRTNAGGLGTSNERMTIFGGGNISIGSTTDNANGKLQITGNLALEAAGNKILITTGTNASAGTGTLSSGTATISTTAVTASSLIFVTGTSCSSCGTMYISAKTAATSFVVTSSNGSDASTFNWWIIN